MVPVVILFPCICVVPCSPKLKALVPSVNLSVCAMLPSAVKVTSPEKLCRKVVFPKVIVGVPPKSLSVTLK